MAHANPEFGIAARAWKAPPERFSIGVTPLSELRARMHEIGALLRIDRGDLLQPGERDAYHAWRRTCRQQRQVEARGRQLDEAIHAGKGMHSGDPKGQRFVEPVPRGEGRTKRWAVR